VVNPYLGDDVLRPFMDWPDKAVIVAVKTSNPGAAIVQDTLLQDGRMLWQHILDLTVSRWNTAGNMIPVIASTTAIDLRSVRKAIPDSMAILFAGYGVQGGSALDLRHLVDSTGRGVFVNSSRGLLYPYDVREKHWQQAVVRATITMKDALNFARSRSRFLLILGVSGVGKSTVIDELRKFDSRFVYISPFMTRTLRPDEKDKVPMTNADLDGMERGGALLAVNELYGVRYATPREPIERAFREEMFPVLDWPIDRLDLMQQTFAGRLFTVYLEPPSPEILQRHLANGRDQETTRFEMAKTELAALARGEYDNLLDHRAVNRENEAVTVAQAIYRAYLKATKL
jgi:guanylate kinase